MPSVTGAPVALLREVSLPVPAPTPLRCPCGQGRPLGVLLGLRSSGRPRLDGQWYCRRGCLAQVLTERARREFPERGVSLSRVRHRVPLGLLLQARGVLSAEQLQQALRMQEISGMRLGDLLVQQFGVREHRIIEAIAAQWGLPVLHGGRPNGSFRWLAPSRLLHASGCVPVECSETHVVLGCAEGPDPALALALERMHTGLRVDFAVIAAAELERYREASTESVSAVQRIRCADRETMADEAASLIDRLQPVDSRAVRVGRLWWLRLWLEEEARRGADGYSEDTLDVLLSATPTEGRSS